MLAGSSPWHRHASTGDDRDTRQGDKPCSTPILVGLAAPLLRSKQDSSDRGEAAKGSSPDSSPSSLIVLLAGSRWRRKRQAHADMIGLRTHRTGVSCSSILAGTTRSQSVTERMSACWLAHNSAPFQSFSTQGSALTSRIALQARCRRGAHCPLKKHRERAIPSARSQRSAHQQGGFAH